MDESLLPPRVGTTKKGRAYISTNNYDTEDDRIWARSPRLKAALLWTGAEWEELVPEERQATAVIGTTAAELEERRRRTAEHQRAALLKQVMDKREEIKLEQAVKAAKDAKKAATGGEKVDTGPDPAAVLAAAQEHMAKLMEASERRIADDRKRLVEAERIGQEKAATQRKIDEELEQRKLEQLEQVKTTRAANLQKRLAREEMRELADEEAIVEGRKMEAARVRRDEEIARNRLRAARAAKAEAKARDRKALALETLERHGGPTKCSPTRSGSRYHQRKSDPAMLAVNNTRWQRTTKPRCGRGDLRRNPRSRAQQANMGRDRRVSS